MNIQDIIINLQLFWAKHGCTILQSYDKEMGAGTSHPATFLRGLDSSIWNVVYMQPSRRPADGRYGENANRLQQFYQLQVVLKPAPINIQDLYFLSLQYIGIDIQKNDIRFVEDNWENPSLGASGTGWEVWLNGMEITQFTYFQQLGGIKCDVLLGEITFGIERLAMHLQNIDNVYDLSWSNDLTYKDIYHQNEIEQSRYNFEDSNVEFLFQLFMDNESEAKRLLELKLIIPSYEMLLSSIQSFNLLDAKNQISSSERDIYIARIRDIANQIAIAYLEYFDANDKKL